LRSVDTQTPPAEEASPTIVAAGGLVWRDYADGLRLAVVHRPRYGDWTLPKGKLRSGEDPESAACREVLEETGWHAQIVAWAGSVAYEVEGTPKLVLFWHMKALDGRFEASDEVIDLAWLARQEASARLDHARERELVDRAVLPGPTSE
jgi:8-oxo-dGTP diphosphatase